MAHGTAALLLANGVGSLISLVRGFYVARTMVPTDYGIWSLVTAMIAYANYADVGVNTGFILEVPTLLGRGEVEEGERVQRQACTATILVSAVVALLTFAASFVRLPLIGDYAASVRIVAAAVLVLALMNYYQVVARIQDRWYAISTATVATTLVSTAGVIAVGVITGHLSVEAAALFTVLGYGASGLIMMFAGRAWPAWPVDWRVLRRLIAVGLPVALLPIAFTLFQNLDRWVVAANVPRLLMGYYGLGATLGLFLYMVPNTLAIVLFTRQIAEFGARGTSERSERLVLLPIQLSGYIMACIAGGVFLAMPFVIHYLTPAYGPALPVARLQVISNCLLFVIPVGANYLISIRRQRLLVVTLTIVALVECALVDLFVRTPLGISGAALAVLLSDVVYSTAVAWLCVGIFRGGFVPQLKRVMVYFLPFGICLPISLGLAAVTGSSVGGAILGDLGRLAGLGLVYLLLCGVLCLLAARATGLLAEPPIATRIRARLPAPLAAALLS